MPTCARFLSTQRRPNESCCSRRRPAPSVESSSVQCADPGWLSVRTGGLFVSAGNNGRGPGGSVLGCDCRWHGGGSGTSATHRMAFRRRGDDCYTRGSPWPDGMGGAERHRGSRDRWWSSGGPHLGEPSLGDRATRESRSQRLLSCNGDPDPGLGRQPAERGLRIGREARPGRVGRGPRERRLPRLQYRALAGRRDPDLYPDWCQCHVQHFPCFVPYPPYRDSAHRGRGGRVRGGLSSPRLAQGASGVNPFRSRLAGVERCLPGNDRGPLARAPDFRSRLAFGTLPGSIHWNGG